MFSSFSLQLVRGEHEDQFIGTGNAQRSSGLGWRVKHIIHFNQARSPTTRSLRRSLAVGAFVCALAISVLAQVDPGPPTPLVPIKPPQSSQQDVPGWIRRGLPGSGHEALEPLVGRWRVRYEVYGTLGRRGDEPPIVSEDVTTRREWIGEGRFIEDTTEGTLMGAPLWRRGWLGYSNMDQRYEWVTIDSVNPTMMTYMGAQAQAQSCQSPWTASLRIKEWLVKRLSASASASEPSSVSTATIVTCSSSISSGQATRTCWRCARSTCGYRNERLGRTTSSRSRDRRAMTMQTQTHYRWWRPSRAIRLFGPTRRLLYSIAIIAAIHASSAFVFTQTSDPSTPAAAQKVPGFHSTWSAGTRSRRSSRFGR